MSAITTNASDGSRVALELRLPSHPRAAAVARASVRDLADTVPAPLAENLGLVVSELVTNALRHAVAADPAPTLTVELGSDRVRVAVTDRGADVGPIAQRREAGADGGFGVRLVDRMADRWSIKRDAGTRVVCEFRRR